MRTASIFYRDWNTCLHCKLFAPEGLTNSLAKRQDYSKAKRVIWFEEKILDMHMAPNSLQVYESHGRMFLCMILVFDEVNDFLAASEHSNINGVNVILTGL